MNESIVRWLIIPGIIIFLFVITRNFRKKAAKPSYKNGIQTPGKFDNRLLTLFKVLTVIPVALMLLGLIIKKSEIIYVNAILTLFFIGIVLLLKKEYAMSYQENDEFFILKTKNKEVQVFYENIVDWQQGLNEISILDRTNNSQKYIGVNISIFKPEILLKKIAEKTFNGCFFNIDIYNEEDPNRKQELIDFYNFCGYGYLIKDYSPESKKM